MEKWKKQVLIVAVIISVISAAPHQSSTFDSSYRLPKTVIPHSYDLSYTTSVHNQGITNFGGDVIIKFEVIEATDLIVLHNRGLSIVGVPKITDIDGTAYGSSHDNDTERDFLKIHTTSVLPIGTYYLDISFTGRLKTTGPNGFYRSQYQVAGEIEPRYLAATQFEPTRAREAFPCFDEPDLRATFKLAITHGLNYTALSNTDGEKEVIDTELAMTTFKETPYMPTYLLAFVISDLGFQQITAGNVRHRVFARPEHVSKMLTLPGLAFTKEYLDVLEKTFDFKYDATIGKMDSVAVPDHGSAMENWGLILYKEQYLILEDNPHPYDMYDVIGTISHEIAHQFFGNVVTCKWWDQIWLNEGFATWVEFMLPELSTMSKSLRFYEMFNIRKTHVAFRADSLKSTRPMTHMANTPSEISDLFDDIAYDKAGAVLRMFQYAIGDDLFITGINQYLKVNQYKSVTSDDLITAIKSVLPENFAFDFARAFRSWELSAGYPVITVNFNSTSKEFVLTQKRYLSASEESSEVDSTSWFIPLSYTTGADPDFENKMFTDYFDDIFPQKTISTENIPEFNGSQWFIFNIQQLGYYRVNYDESNWNKIIQILNSDSFDQIHVLNRAQLIDDAMTFAFDGVISYDIALGIVSYLRRETDYIPWYTAMVAVDKLDYILKGTEHYEDFQKFVRILVRRLYVEHDFERVNLLSNSEQLAVELGIMWSCRAGDERCLDNSYNNLVSRNISKPLEIAYICNGMKGPGRLDEYNYQFNRMDHSVVQTERLRIINGLLCSNDHELLKSFVLTAVNGDTYYRRHEVQRILGAVTQKSEIGLEVLIEIIDEYYNALINRTDDGSIDGLLAGASSRISTDKDEKLIMDLLTRLERSGKPVKPETKDKIVKNIKFNKDWASSHKADTASLFIHNALKTLNDFSNVLRLPKIARPEHYSIYLDVSNLDTGALPYTGEVKIDVRILEVTDRILLHSKDHVINEIIVTDKISMQSIQILDFYQNHDVDTLAIFFVEFLPVNKIIEVSITYSAELLTEIDGFYRDSYVEFDENQSPKTKYLATTQFQAVEARRAFPCFDEPEFRTEFEVTIRHPSTYNAVSNAPVNMRNENDDGTADTIFNPTAKMSTYLLAFLVSDFTFLSNEGSREVGEALQSIYTRPGKEMNAKYGLENSVKLLNELEKFGGMKFSLPKLDSGAIPGKGGGMENWGLVLYREEALVYEDDDEDIAHDLMQRGVRLIAHEVVHMFFGNLVTAEWWNYLWLNEGFATYVMYHITDLLYPDWNMKQFYLRNIMLSYAFLTDASEHTRSMSSELITIDDINDSFDDIAYDKASCVLRMMHYTFGDDIFRDAINRYLMENQYQSVTSDDLIAAFQEVLDSRFLPYDFKRIFRTWEDQEGFPLISVHFHPTDSTFHLTQERFFDNKTRNVNDTSSWFIPLNYGTASNIDFEDTSPSHFFPNGEGNSFSFMDLTYDGEEWFIFNKQQVGYYRVNYGAKNWNALTKALNSEEFKKIHIANRVQLIDDAFRLATAGYIDLQIPYEILLYLRQETDFFAWDIGFEHLLDMFEVFGPHNEALNLFLYHMSKTFYNHYELSGKESIPQETMPERYGRQIAILIACRSGNEDCIRDVIKIGSKDARGEQRIPPGLEEEILCNYFRHTEDRDEFINVFNRMNKLYEPSTSRYKSRLIRALACTKNYEYLYAYLETSLGMHENNVNYTRSEKRSIFNEVAANPIGMGAIFELIENYQGQELPSSYGWSWSTIFKNIASSVYTDQQRYIFLEHMGNVNYTGMLRQDIDAGINAADENINNQGKAAFSNQMDLIVELLNREFLEETTTVSTTTTTEPTTTTTEPTTTTTEPTTTTTEPTTTTTLPTTTTTEPTTTAEPTTTTAEPTTTTTLPTTPPTTESTTAEPTPSPTTEPTTTTTVPTTTTTEPTTTTTTTEPSTTTEPTTTTTEPTTTTTEPTTTTSTTTEPPTTTPDSASSIKISIISFILVITLGIVMNKMEKWKIQVVIVAVIISVISAAPHKPSTFDSSYRLPKTVIPHSYELSLKSEVHLQGNTNYEGTVKIEVEVLEDTDVVTLHSSKLTIGQLNILHQNGTIVSQAQSHTFDIERDFLQIYTSDLLLKGQTYFLEISFNGNLETKTTSGFYRSQYQVAGEISPRYLAATQLKPTQAREAFPCFDEPEYKATYKISITHGSDYHALSHTVGETVDDIGDGYSVTTFSETPKMPIYSVGFVISDLDYYEYPGKRRYRVYARSEHLDKNFTVLPLVYSINFLETLEETFSFNYSEVIGKSDNVALPDHVSAIENWGVSLYKEQFFVLEDQPHPEDLYNLVTSIAHSISHQFFGNVVTCKWWDQIWLNEGFATWLEHKLPEISSMTSAMKFEDFYNIRKTHVVFRMDSLESTRPIATDGNTPSEIMALLDEINYDKPGAILRMFLNSMGEVPFTKAISKYISTYQYESVTSEDLLTILEEFLPESLNINFKHAFRTWEMNKGYPMITVNFNSTNKEFIVTQKRYLSASEESSEVDSTSWFIPLSYTTGANPNFENKMFTDYFVDGHPQKTISTENIPEFDGSQWFIFNIQQLGYYRVNYDESNWNKIIQILNSDNYDQIHVLNRAQLIDDAMTFAFDGVISYDIALGIVSYLRRETDYIPWYTAMVAFDKLDYILKGTEHYEDFQKFVKILVRRLYVEHDFNEINSLTPTEQLAVELAIDMLCRLSDEKCLENAYNNMKSRSLLKPLETTYICNGMKGTGRADEYEHLFDRMDNSILHTERLRIINGLLCSNDPELLKKFILTAIDGQTFYREQEIYSVLEGAVKRSSIGLEVLGEIIDANYYQIIER
ncbi:putative aminopeptidase-2 [Chironomus tepperi]|uniref:putative aminopeptidase-2 n=1 Tax=Chironomus tepperi TaxID=113505 RepID=UPI00391F6661